MYRNIKWKSSIGITRNDVWDSSYLAAIIARRCEHKSKERTANVSHKNFGRRRVVHQKTYRPRNDGIAGYINKRTAFIVTDDHEE